MYPTTLNMMPTTMTPRALILSFPGIFMSLANAGIKSVAIPKITSIIPIPIMIGVMLSPTMFLILPLNILWVTCDSSGPGDCRPTRK